MAAPVWVLSVDLQTKTATFQSGMAEAARSARGAFTDIKSGANEMGGAVGSASGSARQSVMLLGDEFGIHLPRGLTTFISSLGPVGPAMEAAFPFVAIALGATLLIQHLMTLKAAGVKLTEDQLRFGTAVQNAFNSYDQRLIQAGIKADDLRNDHVAALHKELELINLQSMNELVHAFAEVAKEADTVFAGLESHWYTFGIGSAGAKHALTDFQTQYDSLIAKGNSSAASDLLKGTRESAEKVLAMQKQAKGSLASQDGKAGTDIDDQIKYTAAVNALKKSGVGYSEKEIAAQQTLVDALTAQVSLEQKAAQLKKQDGDNATAATAKAASAVSANAAKAAAASQLQMGEASLAADRAIADAKLNVTRASIAERVASEVAFADRELQIELAGNKAQIAALDRMANDYPNALKALHEKAEVLTAQHAAKLAEITSKGAVEQAAKDLQDLEQTEREKIDATDKGSSERLAAIDAAIKEEAARNMQDMNGYRELLTQRVETVRMMAAEEAKLKAEAGKEAAADEIKMGELALAADKSHQAMLDSSHRVSIQARMAEETNAANQMYALKMTAAAHELASLDKSGADYANKLKEIQDKQKQLAQAHENELTAIKEKAETERNSRILSAETRFNDAIAQGLTQTLMGHKSFAAIMNNLGNQVATGMMENAIKSVLANDYTKESDAARAARKAFNAGMDFPFPANIVMAPALGAMAFASVMAFEDGTDSVPGMGRGDTVPAMLTPGEGVVPGGVMDGLRTMVKNGTMGGGPTIHVHHNPTYHVQTIDGDGMQAVLDKHSDQFTAHTTNVIRKMNR